MRGIEIIRNGCSIHTGDDLDLVQTSKVIGVPEVQSYLVEVPGRNGLLNLTKGLTGEVAYKNRTLKMEYVSLDKKETQLEVLDTMNSYHGDFIRIIDDDTPDYYYEGECTVSSEWNGVVLTITLEIDAYPFRRALVPTTASVALTSSDITFVMRNDGRPVKPVVIVETSAVIIHDGSRYTLSPGRYTGLTLQTGNNTITCSGSGTLTISFEEARI